MNEHISPVLTAQDISDNFPQHCAALASYCYSPLPPLFCSPQSFLPDNSSPHSSQTLIQSVLHNSDVLSSSQLLPGHVADHMHHNTENVLPVGAVSGLWMSQSVRHRVGAVYAVAESLVRGKPRARPVAL